MWIYAIFPNSKRTDIYGFSKDTDLFLIILKIQTCVKQKFRSFTFPIELKYHIEQCQSLTFRVSILWWSEIA